MKKVITFAVLTLFFSTTLLAQSYSPCYESAFAEGKRLYNAGQYQNARSSFMEAKDCPDPNTKVANEWIKKCDIQLQKQADEEEKEVFARCTTVNACENYLKEYPKGRYVDVVTRKKWAYNNPIPRIGNYRFGGITKEALQKAEGLVVERDGIVYEVIGYTLMNNDWHRFKATSAAFTTEMRDVFESGNEFVISGIQVKDADGIVRVLPENYGFYIVQIVSGDEKGKEQKKVKKIVGFDENYPEPRVYIHNVHQGMVSKSGLIGAGGIVLDSPVQYEVVGYTVGYKTKSGNSKQTKITGRTYSDEIKNAINSSNFGDRFYFQNIDVKGADGIVRTVITCISVEIK